MKILVTGGAGFIGSHIVDFYLSHGHDVIVYDNFSSGFLENLDSENDRLSIVKGDILDYDLLKKSINGCDYVSHHAAQLEIFLAMEDPLEDLQINTIGTLNVLKASRENQVRRVINISSACVYGQTEKATSENTPAIPNWDYGVSKLAAEKYAQIFNDYKGLEVVSLRYGIVYGEREWFRRVLPIFLKRVIQNQAPVVFGEGNQVRDFIYVGDVVALHDLCLRKEEAHGQVFNVGTGEPTTIDTLANTCINVSGLNLETIYENTSEGEFSKLIQGKKRNTAELGTMLLDISKAKNILGWEPKTSLFEGLQKEYKWATDNLQRWEKVFSTKW